MTVAKAENQPAGSRAEAEAKMHLSQGVARTPLPSAFLGLQLPAAGELKGEVL